MHSTGRALVLGAVLIALALGVLARTVNEELFWPAFGFVALAFGLGAWEKRRGPTAR
jgi:hypothetical protein